MTDTPKRSNAGEAHYAAKLTEQDVRDIRELHTDGLSTYKLGAMYKMSNVAIWNIIKRNSWRHVL